MSSFPKLRVTGIDGPTLGDPAGHFWAKLSTEVLADPEVSDAEKVALTAIVSLTRAGGCTATNEELGRACGKDADTFARLARRLERRGLIEREQLGRTRTIRLNFGFRGPTPQTADPGRSAGANNCPTPAPLPTIPGRSAGEPRRECRGTPADAPPSLRLSRAEPDPALDRGPAPARVGQAPPSPSPGGAGESDDCALIDCPAGPPTCPDLDEATRRRFPPRGGSIFAPWPIPITQGDLLSAEQRAWTVEVLAAADPTGRAWAEAWIRAKRHNAAIWLGMVAAAQQNGQPPAVDVVGLAVPGADEPARQTLPEPTPESTKNITANISRASVDPSMGPAGQGGSDKS